MEKLTDVIKKINEIRKFKTIDIVKRLGVLSADRISLENYPEKNPVKAFNASILVKKDNLYIYARLILGYYRYISVIARIDANIADIISGNISARTYPGEIIVGTDTEYDFWGSEDPRVQIIGDKVFMTYTGRTKWYFEKSKSLEKSKRISSLVAKSNDGIKNWRKVAVLIFPEEHRNGFEMSKNVTFLNGKNNLHVLHRPQFYSKYFPLVIGAASKDVLQSEKLKEFKLKENTVVYEAANFEDKVGWGPPPIKVGNDEYIILLHGVDNYLKAYRIFAMLLREEKKLKPIAVTPHYIMEPKTMYELYGDRPMVVFPCGAQIIDDNIIISYGAADAFIGFGSINLSQLMAILDKNRID